MTILDKIYDFFIARRNRIQEKQSKELKADIKNRLQRYFEDGQRQNLTTFKQTKQELLRSNLYDRKYSHIADEVLADLLKEGILKYDGGEYFLAGYEPQI